MAEVGRGKVEMWAHLWVCDCILPAIRPAPRGLQSRRTGCGGNHTTSDLSYRGQLSEGTGGPRGEVKGGSSLAGVGKGRLWRKGSRKGVDRGAHRVSALLSHLSRL